MQDSSPSRREASASVDEIGSLLCGAIRFFSSCAACLFGAAIFVGVQARPNVSPSRNAPESPLRVTRNGPTTRVLMAIPGGENASHFVLSGPCGDDLFEISGFRDGHVVIRCGAPGPTQAALSTAPDGRVAISLRRRDVIPKVHVSPDRTAVEVAFLESRATILPASMRIWTPAHAKRGEGPLLAAPYGGSTFPIAEWPQPFEAYPLQLGQAAP